MTAGQLCPGCQCDERCGPGTCECPPGSDDCPRCAARTVIISAVRDRSAAVVRQRLDALDETTLRSAV